MPVIWSSVIRSNRLYGQLSDSPEQIGLSYNKYYWIYGLKYWLYGLFCPWFLVIFMKSCNCHPYFNNITFKWEFKSDLNLSYKVKLDIWSILGCYQFSKSPHPIFTPFHSTTDIWSYCLYGQFVRAKTADHISGMECMCLQLTFCQQKARLLMGT